MPTWTRRFVLTLVASLTGATVATADHKPDHCPPGHRRKGLCDSGGGDDEQTGFGYNFGESFGY